MKIYLGKISRRLFPDQLEEGYYRAPKSSSWYNGIEIGDYAFVIGGDKIQLWKAREWQADPSNADNDRLLFDILVPNLGIRTKQFSAIKYFKVTMELLVFAVRSTGKAKKAFFPIELVEDIPPEVIENPKLYQESSTYRSIEYRPDYQTSPGDSGGNVLLYRDENGRFCMVPAPFIDDSVQQSFNDNTPFFGKGQEKKDKTLQYLNNLKSPKIIPWKEVSLLNLYDACCVPYHVKEFQSEEDDAELDDSQESTLQESELMRSLYLLLRTKKQVILQGAPGVGKTYTTKELALRILGESIPLERSELNRKYQDAYKRGRIVFVTFHQSMDYEEFVEGFKPAEGAGGQPTFRLEDGPFKMITQACIGTDSEKKFEEAWDKFIESFEGKLNIEAATVAKKTKFYVRLTDNGALRVGTKPDEEGQYTMTKQQVKDWILYNTEPGYNPSYAKGVARLIQDTYKVPSFSPDQKRTPHVLIIDEINRGNVSKVFGELITLLETDKREADPAAGSPGETITVKLTYSKKDFYVPYNLYIIGTMNTADRSLGQIDYALRRRFAFHTVKSNEEAIHAYYENLDLPIPDGTVLQNRALKSFREIREFFEGGESTTARIHPDFDPEDVMVGHSYFMAATREELDARIKYEVLPLLEEYRKDGILVCSKADEGYTRLREDLGE